jgi:hypothetical protein
MEPNGEHMLNSSSKLNEWFSEQAKQRVIERKIPFRQALSEVIRESPALVRLMEELRRKEDRRHGDGFYTLVDGQLREVESQIQAQVDAARKEHPEFSYGQAFRVAASERPELFRTRERFRDLLQK